MISQALIKKIKQIEIKSLRLSDELLSGSYHSHFKGKGMAFEDIREYYHGDDVRNIDWNVTARYNQAYVKQFSEERELNMFLLVDVSKSNDLENKRDYIASLGATLSYSANKNNDKVGLILFSDEIEKYVPSKAGRKHTLSIIETILNHEPKSSGTNINEALKFFNQIEKKRSIVFVISDFMDKDFKQGIKMVGRKHDLVLIQVLSPLETKLPKGAIFTFEDLETGETFVVDNSLKSLELGKDFGISGSNVIQLYTHEDYVKPLKLFFHRKVRK